MTVDERRGLEQLPGVLQGAILRLRGGGRGHGYQEKRERDEDKRER
jgi:hypothetical protein